MSAAGEPASCPDCDRSGRRVFGAPALRSLPAGLRSALDRQHQSADAPTVVTSVPPRSGRTQRRPPPTPGKPGCPVREPHSRVAGGSSPCPDVVFRVDQAKSMRDQVVPGHNRWHPDIPPAASVTPGERFRVECREWTDAQIGNNDSRERCPRRRTRRLPHAVRSDRDRGRRARRPARRRHPRPRPVPAAAGGRRRARPGLGLHRHLRQGQRRRLPHRPLPRRLQGDLGLPRPGGHLAPHPGRPLHRHHPPGPVRHRALGRPARGVEPARAGADRHRPRPRPAAGPATARGGLPGRHGHGRGAREDRPRGRAHRPRARERRQPRHQELHPREPRLLPGARPGGEALGRRPPLLPGGRGDHVLRRDRDGWVHRLRRGPDQGRHEQVRRPTTTRSSFRAAWSRATASS